MYQNVSENFRNLKNISSMVGMKGKIIEFAKVLYTTQKFNHQKPYYVALIELEDGNKITAQLTDTDSVTEGMTVVGVFRKLFSVGRNGLIQYGVKFRVIK